MQWEAGRVSILRGNVNELGADPLSCSSENRPLRLASGFLGEYLFCPAKGRVGGGEADGREGEDDGVQDLCFRSAGIEELADV